MSKHETRPDRKTRSGSDTQIAGHRHERLSRILREEVAALVRDELSDPRLDGVTVTFVELSVDYKSARVGFIGPGAANAMHADRDRMARALARATPFLRMRLAESVDLKVLPALRFSWDAYAAADPAGPRSTMGAPPGAAPSAAPKPPSTD
jgi:ribosome-binding factor A